MVTQSRLDVAQIGDRLDRLTGGFSRSTPHRVRNLSERDRRSFPFCCDPNFDAALHPIVVKTAIGDDNQHEWWDKANVHQFTGTYGDDGLSKVAKVFPELRQEVL